MKGQRDIKWFHFYRINIHNITGYLSAGYFLNQQSTTFQDINSIGGVTSTFVPERSVGVQIITTGSLPDRDGVEISTFQKYILSTFSNP